MQAREAAGTREGAVGRIGPPRGGEVDPTFKAGKPSQLPPTTRAAQASFRPHQATSRWRGATVTVKNGLVSTKNSVNPILQIFFPQLAHWANFAIILHGTFCRPK
ncbi:hypothetical protein V6N13_043023 [Hibiscus sabdariffa]